MGKGAKGKNPFIILSDLSDYAKSIVIAAYIDGNGYIRVPKDKQGNRVYQSRMVLSVETINKKLVEFLLEYFDDGVLKETKKTRVGNQCYKFRKIVAKRSTKYKDLMVLKNMRHEKKVERIQFIFENTVNKLNIVKNVEETDIDVAWDISTLKTGTYTDKYGFVKKQCDGNPLRYNGFNVA